MFVTTVARTVAVGTAATVRNFIPQFLITLPYIRVGRNL